MKHKIMNFIEDNGILEGTLFVLKGFSVQELEKDIISINEVIDNKINHFFFISQSNPKIISYEEFIFLYDFIISQFKKIFILENGLYSNLFPIDVTIPENITVSLINHFDEDIDSECPIDEISEYINIYSNFLSTENGNACCYNIPDNSLKIEKIERITFGTDKENLQEIETLSDDLLYINLCDEIDYFQLVQRISKTSESFAVVGENYAAGKEIIMKKLQTLSTFFYGRIFIYQNPSVRETRHCNRKIYEIMERYWGYKNFRQIHIYDLRQLEHHNKKVVQISQEDIIYDLIKQTENCINEENFHDIFVTAPTGAGKSLMFQIPAMYLAEEYGLLTIVITPLIGLMNDQVQALNYKGYSFVRTINSDIPPIIKQEILEEVSEGKCHILYLSPESLLSRSDIEQLIGKRRIGMLIVDESHIVTTWGKQFRPDYWYLGDHVQKLRHAQSRKEDNPSPFIIATFTATAIYEGAEDMYHETLNSLHMIDPITYLGYLRRENISIEVSEVEVKRNKTEYEMNKFDALISMINTAIMRNQKTLIYFPTVALINRFYDYCYSKSLNDYVTKYNGQMDANTKNENFHAFLEGEKTVMLATKAFGMGIDIPDISIVSHFSPTGNVCDYMQEIGRAARDKNINGHAIYKHMSNDFKHINKLHGLSALKKYQLIEVIKKILELYTNSRYSKSSNTFTKKRNEMLVDAESFSYIFDGPQSDENDLINKVKTAMLLIQKDYENRGFSPFHMRPIPLFAYGYFSLTTNEQKRLSVKYNGSVKLIFSSKNVCEVNLKNIWEKSYDKIMSFPKFKFLLYSKNKELDFNQKYIMKPAMFVEIYKENNYDIIYKNISQALNAIAHSSVYKGIYLKEEAMILELTSKCSLNRFKAESIMGVFLAAVNIYQREYSNRLSSRMFLTRVSKGEKVSYQFTNVIREFFGWLQKGFDYVEENTIEQKMYIADEDNIQQLKQITTALGLLESMGVLRFKSLGGSNSQIYIYVNETKNMQIVRDKPNFYKNRLLETINQRHIDSVKMLTFLFQNNLQSDEIWNHLENYFLGILPGVFNDEQKTTDDDVSVLFQVGENLEDYYDNWEDANILFDNDDILKFDDYDIPLADYYAAKLIIGTEEIQAQLAWTEKKVVISSGEETSELRELARVNGWNCLPINQINFQLLSESVRS